MIENRTNNPLKRPAAMHGRFAYKAVDRMVGDQRVIQRGFTLIEIMVVIVIIAIMSSMAVISIGDNFYRELQKEAERLQAIIAAAADESIYSSSELGLYLTDKRYAALRYDKVARGWVLLTERPFEIRELPENMKMRISVEGFAAPSSELDRYGDADYEEIALFEEDEDDPDRDRLQDIQRVLKESGVDLEAAGSLSQALQLETMELVPQIYLLSSGEQTAFTVEFVADFDDASNRSVALVSDGFSSPRIKSSSGEAIAAVGQDGGSDAALGF